MATLTGSTIASTYTQLLKLTSASLGADASAKYIEDGLGTDSALSLSTTRVGIGTATPSTLLQLYKLSDPTLTITNGGTATLKVIVKDNENIYFSVDAALGKFQFCTASDGTSNPRMILDANSRISLSNNDSGLYNTIFGNDVGDPVSGQDHNTCSRYWNNDQCGRWEYRNRCLGFK